MPFKRQSEKVYLKKEKRNDTKKWCRRGKKRGWLLKRKGEREVNQGNPYGGGKDRLGQISGVAYRKDLVGGF